MRRVLKIFLIVLASLIVLFAGVWLLADRFLLRNLDVVAEKTLTEVLDAPVDVGAVSFHPFKGLTLSDCSVSASNRSCLTVDRLSLGFNLLSLLSGRLSFSSARLEGLSLILSSGKTNLLPFYVSRADRLRSRSDAKRSLPFKIGFEILRLDRASIRILSSDYLVDRIEARPGPSGVGFRVEMQDLRGLISLKAEGRWAATNSVMIAYQPLKPAWKARVSEGRLSAVWSDISDMRGVNTLSGNNLRLTILFKADLKSGRVGVVDNPSNILMIPSGRINVSGSLEHWDIWTAALSSPSADISSVLPEWQGSAVLNSRFSGSIKSRKWTLNAAEVKSSRISTAGIVSNGLVLSDLVLNIRENRITSGRCGLAAGNNPALDVKFRTGDLFRKPVEIACEVSGGQFDIAKSRPIRRSPAPESAAPSRTWPVSLDLQGRIDRVAAGRRNLDRVVVSVEASGNGAVKGSLRCGFEGASVKSTFDYSTSESSLRWAADCERLDLSAFVSSVTTSLSGGGNGTWSPKTGSLTGRMEISSGSMTWRGLDFSRLSGVVAMTGRSVTATGVKAGFYGGDMVGMMQYDLAGKSGSFALSGTGVKVEDLFPVLVPEEPGARVSGRAGCEVKGMVTPAGAEVRGRLEMGKGIIRDTRYQTEFDRILSTDAFNDLIYDSIRADFTISPAGFEIDPLVLVSPDLEIEMETKQSRAVGGAKATPRTSTIDLFMSEDWLNRMQNPIIKLPLVVSSRKGRTMKWLRLVEADGILWPVKPGK